METEKVKKVKKTLEFCTSLKKRCRDCDYNEIGCYKLLKDILTLINELESENEALQKGVKRLKKRYEETITKNADECVKKFCETTMYHEQKKLVEENQQLKDRIAELENEKTEQLKQFAERLKEKAKIKLDLYGWQIIDIEDIDETLKEFINKGDEEK